MKKLHLISQYSLYIMLHCDCLLDCLLPLYSAANQRSERWLAAELCGNKAYNDQQALRAWFFLAPLMGSPGEMGGANNK